MSSSRAPRPLIVVVEDDPAVLNSLEFSLEVQGYDVCPFERGTDALNSARVLAADCLVIDYALPDGDGVGLLHALRLRGFGRPAIIIASNPSPRCRRETDLAGARLIEKPLMGDTLGDNIRATLSASSKPSQP